jgi:hypothetical protein
MKSSLASALGLGLALCPAAALAQAVGGSVTVGAPSGAGVAQVQGDVQAGAPVPVAPAQPIYVQQPAPVYAYPQPGYVVPGARVRRRVVPYNGGPIPPNAHLEEQPITGLIIAGSVLFGVSYVPSAFAALLCVSCSSSGIGWLGVPVVGPLITLGFPQSEEGARLLVLDAIFQIGGVGMLIAGLAVRNRVLVVDEYARREQPRRTQWAFAPGAPGAPAGLSFALTHF